jgi:hypothetical protein
LRRFSTILKILVSAAILFVLFRKANLQQGIHFAAGVNYPYILISIAIIVLAQLARAHRLAVMVLGGAANGNFLRMLRIQMVSFLPGIISPAKIGEAAKIYMLQKQLNISFGKAAACFVAERIFDMLVLVPLAVLGLCLLLPSLSVSLRSGGVLALVIVAAGTAAGVPVGYSFAKRRGMTAADVWQAAAPLRLFEAGMITVAYWGLVFLEVWLLCKAALFAPPVWRVALVVPPALLSSLLPVTFSGFGVREAAMVFLFQRPELGATYNQALLVSLMYIVFGLGVPALMGLWYWLIERKDGTAQN